MEAFHIVVGFMVDLLFVKGIYMCRNPVLEMLRFKVVDLCQDFCKVPL